MQKTLVSFLLLFCCTSSFAQKNWALKKELDSIYVEDQKFRDILNSGLFQTKADSLAILYNVPKDQVLDHIIKMIPLVDSSNLYRVEQIMQQYGYPGLSLVGAETNEAAFFVIQHSQAIDKYLPIIKKAVDQKELSFTLYAMMLDRSLVYKEKEQIYGTQGSGLDVINPQTNKKEFKRIIWPIKDVKNVNQRRKKAGFKETVEENAKNLGIEYKVLTLADVKKMKLH